VVYLFIIKKGLVIKALRIVACFMIICLLYGLFPYGKGVIRAERPENRRWSFDFDKHSVSDVLREITRVTDITILASRGGDEEVSRSYKDQTVDYILRDIFRKENCAIIWRYGNGDLVCIDIWLFKARDIAAGADDEKYTKQDERKSKMFTGEDNIGSETVFAKKEVTNSEKNGSPTALRELKGHVTASKKTVDARTNRLKHVVSAENLDNTIVETSGEDGEKGEETNNLAVAPIKQYGLEPPPMPPGFSY
jgi:hypothetical protein